MLFRSTAPKAKPKKLSYKEQQEYDSMETAVLAAEELSAQRQEAVQQASSAGHAALSEACRLLEESQREVERLYARWQELEARAAGG